MNKLTIALVTAATSVAFAQPKDAAKAPKMEMPKAPAEVAEAGKKMVGTWNCTGNIYMDMADATKATPQKSKITTKLDGDKGWILASVTGMPFKIMQATTYDAFSKKWYRVTTDNVGGSDISWSAGPSGTMTMWEGEARGMGMKPWKTRLTEEMVSAKEVKMTGESNMDGKGWRKDWESTCKK